MQWFPEAIGNSAVSDEGYRITWEPMGRACWCNAYSPRGTPLASGRLTRCLDACDKHLTGETRGKGKRQFRPPFRRRTRKEMAMGATA